MNQSNERKVVSGVEWLIEELKGMTYGRINLGVVVHNGAVVRLLRTIEDQPLECSEDRQGGIGGR